MSHKTVIKQTRQIFVKKKELKKFKMGTNKTCFVGETVNKKTHPFVYKNIRKKLK